MSDKMNDVSSTDVSEYGCINQPYVQILNAFDTKENWDSYKGDNDYIPGQGEIIFYRIKENNEKDKTKTKVGNGVTPLFELPFQEDGNNVAFEEGTVFKVTHPIGHITQNQINERGYVEVNASNLSVKELFEKLLTVELDGVTQPSFSLAAGAITTDTGTYEIGSRITSIGWNGTFNAGSYSYGSKKGNEIFTDKGTEVTADYKVVCSVSGSFANGVDGVVTLNSPIVVDVASNKIIATVTNTCTWGDSPRTPISNIGNEIISKKISSGSSTKAVDLKVIGFREGFFYGTRSTKIMPKDITSNIIRSLNKTNAKYSKGDKSVTIPEDAATIIFACPMGSTGVTKVYNNTVNADMTSSFTKTENVSVGGADATAENIGNYQDTYNVWTFTPGEPYTKEAKLTITLG